MNELRIYKQNVCKQIGIDTYIEVTFYNEKKVIATQISVNKRINKDKNFGCTYINGEFGDYYNWTTETNEQIKNRIELDTQLEVLFY